jgi:hypothetical protein
VHGRDITVLERTQMIKSYFRKNHHAKLLREHERAGETLSPEDQLIVKKSNMRKEKEAETR